ncbi:hypothetical protein ORF070R [Spotted knifejaw iridovirus]|nr:hypothetical protein ORF070R [Spotted knifejaw iridovirus]
MQNKCPHGVMATFVMVAKQMLQGNRSSMVTPEFGVPPVIWAYSNFSLTLFHIYQYTMHLIIWPYSNILYIHKRASNAIRTRHILHCTHVYCIYTIGVYMGDLLYMLYTRMPITTAMNVDASKAMNAHTVVITTSTTFTGNITTAVMSCCSGSTGGGMHGTTYSSVALSTLRSPTGAERWHV